MAGHNKWSKIKRQKAVTDAKRSNIFSKLSREITVAAKQGGGDVDTNASLRAAVDKAKQERMPKENIKRAIDKGVGGGAEADFAEVVYEGYGPSGVAFLVKGLTDNKNRTVAEVRNLFNKAGGSLGTSGSTTYIFADPENPVFEVEVDDLPIARSLYNLCENLEDHDDVQEVYTNFVVNDSISTQL